MNIEFEYFLKDRQKQIEEFLKKVLSIKPIANKLWQAMNYSCLNGGKRLRGILCLAVCEAFEVDYLKVLPIAAGIECIHAMSLIHDDLPCMDNDILRRGKPTCHIQFDEATALLAGDALLIEGLHLFLQAEIESFILIEIIKEINLAIGARGMTGGQSIDLENTNKNINLADLEQMHKLKTGAFLRASILAGALAGKASTEQIKALSLYADNIGLAFQIIDDLLDIEGEIEQIGKTTKKDLNQNKATYPKILGINESKQKAFNLIEEAKFILIQANIKFEPLHKIADYVIERQK